MRKGLLVENPGAASAIFTPGEIGQADDPTLTAHDRERLQQALDASHAKTPDERWHNEPDTDFTREQRRLADESSRWPVLLLLVFAFANVLFMGPLQQSIPLIVTRELGGDSQSYSSLLSGFGAGMTLGGLLMLRFAPRQQKFLFVMSMQACCWPCCPIHRDGGLSRPTWC